MKPRFEGKVAIVTGSARGIGLAISTALAREGARVTLSDILAPELEQAAEGLRSTGAQVLTQATDVTSDEGCRRLVEATLDGSGGRLDILVNNAGISIVAPFEDCTPEACRRLLDVNLMGSIQMSLAALPALKVARGHLIFVSSVSGIRAIPSGALYSASKAALRSLAESLRLELRPSGVHVGVISPGFTPTESSKTVLRGDGSLRPIDRPAHDTPENVARETLTLIAGRQRERVLTPLGKATLILQRISPTLVDHALSRMRLKS
ncbi:MAG: SDR family NAD(P)-dependent oxidoreductase [Polyangia bacterium]|jgi:NAD(P)-dependent dehydrogenase (short-subunit alcohol dehydrogenase family)|nr:SDR family NAD(P)-dependent oxidoreductase [Polyangia bacterium]